MADGEDEVMVLAEADNVNDDSVVNISDTNVDHDTNMNSDAASDANNGDQDDSCEVVEEVNRDNVRHDEADQGGEDEVMSAPESMLELSLEEGVDHDDKVGQNDDRGGQDNARCESIDLCSEDDDVEEEEIKSESVAVESDDGGAVIELLDDDDESDEEPVEEISPDSSFAAGGEDEGSSGDGRCPECLQTSFVPVPEGDAAAPDRLTSEFHAIKSDRLQVQDMDEDDRRTLLLADFYFFDSRGHLVDLAARIIERGKAVYFSGRVYPVCHDGPFDDDGGVRVVKAGPVQQWWTHQSQIAVTTEKADYYLRTPHNQYKIIYDSLVVKNDLTNAVQRIVTEAMENGEEDLKYDELLSRLASTEGTADPDEQLLEHGVSVLGFIWEFDQAADDDETVTLTSCPALKTLAGLVGYKFRRRPREPEDAAQRAVRAEQRQQQQPRRGFVAPRPKVKTGGSALPPNTAMATTTPLVKAIFEGFFKDQLAKEDGGGGGQEWAKRRCNACQNCLKADCGQCKGCRKMSKFSGEAQVGKATCLNRPCLADSQQECMIVDEVDTQRSKRSRSSGGGQKTKVTLNEEEVSRVDRHEVLGSVSYYRSAALTSSADGAAVQIAPGDFVTVRPDMQGQAQFVAQVLSITRDESDPKGVMHVRWMCRSADTILGNDSEDENELFALNSCEDVPLSSVTSKQAVRVVPPPADWKMMGGTQQDAERWTEITKTPFCRFFYDPVCARFTTINRESFMRDADRVSNGQGCDLCRKERERRLQDTPRLEEDEDGKVLLFKGEKYRVGDACFVNPDPTATFAMPFEAEERKFRAEAEQERKKKLKAKKTKETTEFFRINVNNTPLGYGVDDVPSPFRVCVIEKMTRKPSESAGGARPSSASVWLRLRTLFRPEDTSSEHLTRRKRRRYELNEVFWSTKTKGCDAVHLRGKVELLPEELVAPSMDEWREGSANRFFFTKIYNPESGLSDVPPALVEHYRNRNNADPNNNNNNDVVGPQRPPLRALEVFAGCGGLSEGLEQSGVSRSEWAIEFHQPAAEAFKANKRDCAVITDDCNKVLAAIMRGKESMQGIKLPKKGEVELMSGGPPCQGYSLLNSFSEGEYSQLKNSQVASYLAYADFLRPDYFLMENVRNFANFKKSLILKLCMRTLVRIGYQCTFGILQAGNFGVPQSRCRCFLLAAAPGQVLPSFPEPRHVFPQRAHSGLHVVADERRFTNGQRWTDSAPYRETRIRDSISDLPPLRDVQTSPRAVADGYLQRDEESLTPFQRMCRKGGGGGDGCRNLDHEIKPDRPITQARFQLVPTDVPNADWRLLPNRRVTLSDGTTTDVLDYRFDTPDGRKKGLCKCMERSRKGSLCPYDLKYKGPRQELTIIPWRLPHTAKNHNQWSSNYGRLPWDGFFTTVVTQAHPESKQGRVLHPDQHRVVSVRECARSQGFPDDYIFSGSIKDKYRQIGNAVPPPLAKAIGQRIAEAVADAERAKRNVKK